MQQPQMLCNIMNIFAITILISVQVSGNPGQTELLQQFLTRGDEVCVFEADCTVDYECVYITEYHSIAIGTCEPINSHHQDMWIHYPIQWCTSVGRNPEKLGVMPLEACQQNCTGLCKGIEWWEGDSACFECTDPLSKKDFNNTEDSGYPPHVYAKALFCHSSVISCPEFCESGHSDNSSGRVYEICGCTSGCHCPGDGWCYVDGPVLPRCGFATCQEECTVEEVGWKKQTYQSCKCPDSDLCYMGALNEECQGAVEIFPDDSIQDSTLLALPDGAFAGLCHDWSSPELANGIWFKFVPSGDTTSYRATTVSLMTNYDTQIAVFSSITGDCSILECLGSNDDFINLQSEVVFVSESGMVIYILVAGLIQAKGRFELLVEEYEDQPVKGLVLKPDVHKTVDGCPDINAGKSLDSFPTCSPDSEAVAAAMCCSTHDDTCSLGSYCSGLVTYDEAKLFCLNVGNFRLCTPTDIENSECCESPCLFDLQKIWSPEKCTDEDGTMEIFYESVGGGASKLGWDLLADYCSLDGVACQNGRVTTLLLSGMMLSGKIPSELGNLINLLELDLSDNELVGFIPKELGNLQNLVLLYLSGNQLSGPVPWELGDHRNLAHLCLSDNELLGSIPCELGNVQKLSKLLLSGNRLSGTIPSELGNLGALVELDLSDNELSGSNPNELGNLSNLTLLYLSGNGLTGTIQTELGYLSRIKFLSLHDNRLSGTIPAEFINLVNVNELDLSYNELSGKIPSYLDDLTTIVELDLSNNDLSDTIPSALANLGSIHELDLSNNDIFGTIPKEFGHPQNLVILNLSHNLLTGSIPSDLGALSNLVELHLSHNELSGEIPSELGNAQRLTFLNTESNDGLGMFPEMRCCFEMRHHYRTVGGPILFGGNSGAGRLVQQYKLQNNKEVITVDIAMNNANLVCKSLGLGKAFVVFEGTPYGKGTEPYYVQTIENVSSFTTGSYEIISLICDTGTNETIFIGFGIIFFILLLGVFVYTCRESEKPSILAKIFLWNSMCAIVIGIMTCDTLLDILVAAQLYGTGQIAWFSASVVILAVSSVLLALCFSRTLYYELQIHEVLVMCLIGHTIPVILFLHPLLSARMRTRYERWSHVASRVVGIPGKEDCHTRMTKFIKNQMDAAFIFAIIERFSGSIPQMVLQLSIATANRGITPIQGASLLVSWLSICTASVMFAWCSDNASVIFLVLASWSDVVLLALTACMLSINTTISQDVFFMTKQIPLLMAVWAYTVLAVFIALTLTSLYKFVSVLQRWSVKFDGVWSYLEVVPMLVFSVLTGFITTLIIILLNFSFFVLEHTRMDKTCFSPGELSSFLDQASCFSMKHLYVTSKEKDETSDDYGSIKCISVVVRWNIRLLFKSTKTASLFAIFKLYLCVMVLLTYFYEHTGFGLYPLGTIVDVAAYSSVVLSLLTIVLFPRFAKYRYFAVSQQHCRPSNPPPLPKMQKRRSISHTDTPWSISRSSYSSGTLASTEAANFDETRTSVDVIPKSSGDNGQIEML